MFQMTELLLFFQFLQSSDGRLHCDGRVLLQVQVPLAIIFMQEPQPHPHNSPLHLGFAIERAGVLGVLADFNFLHYFPEGGTIMGLYLPIILALVHQLCCCQVDSRAEVFYSFCQVPEVAVWNLGIRVSVLLQVTHCTAVCTPHSRYSLGYQAQPLSFQLQLVKRQLCPGHGGLVGWSIPYTER